MQILQFDWLGYSFTISHKCVVAAVRIGNARIFSFLRCFEEDLELLLDNLLPLNT